MELPKLSEGRKREFFETRRSEKVVMSVHVEIKNLSGHCSLWGHWSNISYWIR